MAPIADHIYSLYAVAREGDMARAVPAEVADWLILAAGLKQVSIVTNGLSHDDVYCSNIYEESRGPATAAVATELTRLLFLWGALQGLMRVKWARKREQGQPRLMAMLVDSQMPTLLHHECAARNLLDGLERHREEAEYAKVLGRASRLEAGVIGQSTFAAYQLRNSLAHGSVPWPDDDSFPSRPAVFLASTACRVLTFAVQCLLLELAPADSEVEELIDDEWARVRIGEFLGNLHLYAGSSSG
jgi:hypothetical protein